MARLYTVERYDGSNQLNDQKYYTKETGNRAEFSDLIWSVAQTSGYLTSGDIVSRLDTALTTGGYNTVASPTSGQLQTFETGVILKQDSIRLQYSLHFIGG